jgi:outer membrane protein TolC
MRHARCAALAALFSILLGTGAARAQEPAPLRLSLADAIRRALDEGTAARLATSRIGEAEARALEARSALQPQLSAGTLTGNESLNLQTFGFQPEPGEPPVVGPFNVIDAHITLAMNVIDLAARRRWAAAQAGVRVTTEERRRTENEVAAAVASLYVTLGRSAARIDEIRSNVDLFERLKQLAVDQKEAGVGTRLDTTRADIQLARQRQSLLVATNQRDLARLALLRAIGADLGAGVELADDWSRLREPVPTLDQALATAREGRPEMTLLAERLRAAGLLVEAAKAEKLPTVAAQAQAVENGNRLRDLAWNRTFIATVNVPLFTGRRIEARVAAARSQQEQLLLEQRDTERQVEEEVRRALLLLENARSRVELAGQSVKLVEDELEQASDRFKAGVASSIEVDNAQTSLATARDLRIDALADEAQARFNLARATGQIRALVPSDTSSKPTQNARFEGEKKP